MVADTPVIEDRERKRVKEVEAARLREALDKRRRFIYEQFRGLLRTNLVLFVCGISVAAFCYHRYELHQLASTTSSVMAAKLNKAANSTSIHQSIVNEETQVNQAAGQD